MSDYEMLSLIFFVLFSVVKVILQVTEIFLNKKK